MPQQNVAAPGCCGRRSSHAAVRMDDVHMDDMRMDVDTSVASATTIVGSDRSSLAGPNVVGTWVSPNGSIRLNLRPDGRYDESHGRRPRLHAYRGRYIVAGARVDFDEDSGFHSIGVLHAGVLSLGSDHFHRER